MRLVAPVVLCVIFALGAGGARAQAIEITSDLAGTQREGAVRPGEITTLYILGRAVGPVADGFAFAEFWVSGLPANWPRAVIPNPASVASLGNPFATAPPYRADIAFATCISPDANSVILLYTVILSPTTLIQDGCLTVQVAVPPTNPSYTTPIIGRGCDSLDELIVAAWGLQFIMNPVTGRCALGVEAATWDGVKRLYAE